MKKTFRLHFPGRPIGFASAIIAKVSFASISYQINQSYLKFGRAGRPGIDLYSMCCSCPGVPAGSETSLGLISDEVQLTDIEDNELISNEYTHYGSKK